MSIPKLGAMPLALVASGVVLHLLLVKRAGFVIAAAVLFWLTARAFDPHHPCAMARSRSGLSAASYVLFARVLAAVVARGAAGALVLATLGPWTQSISCEPGSRAR
jgi:hypothetical protein